MTLPEARSYTDFVIVITGILEQLEIPYAVAGSLASGLYGEPRTTLDVDLTLQLPSAAVPRFAAAVEAVELSVDDAAIRERLREADPQPFNVIDAFSGWKADCYPLRNRPFDRSAFERRRQISFPAAPSGRIWIYAPEDVILYKMAYYAMSDGISVKHLRDIAGMLAQVAGGAIPLDIAYIERWSRANGHRQIWDGIAHSGAPGS